MTSYHEWEKQMQEFQTELNALAFEVLMFESIVLDELKLSETNKLKDWLEELTKNISEVEHEFKDFRASVTEMTTN